MSNHRIKVRDKVAAGDLAKLNADIAKVTEQKLTGEGFLRTPARIARTGIQEYTALELGLDASMRTVRLYRSPDEVFKPEALASFEAQTITFYHPEKGVDSGNWKATAVGDFHNVMQDEADKDYVAADLIIRDADAVRAIAYGVKELSCGYSFDIDMTAGTTPEGQSYDGQQTNIYGNHLAIVYSGRCGSGCAVGDCSCATPPKTTTTSEDTMKVNGIDITLDHTNAQIVQSALDENAKTIATMTSARDAEVKRANDAEAALKTLGEQMKQLATDHKTATDGLKAQILTPEQQATMAADYAMVLSDAKLVIADAKIEGTPSIAQIRTLILDAVLSKDATDEKLKGIATKMLGGEEPAKASEVRAKAAFDAVVAFRGALPDDDGAGSEYRRSVADALTGGDKKTGDAPELGGRLLMIARERGLVARQ